VVVGVVILVAGCDQELSVEPGGSSVQFLASGLASVAAECLAGADSSDWQRKDGFDPNSSSLPLEPWLYLRFSRRVVLGDSNAVVATFRNPLVDSAADPVVAFRWSMEGKHLGTGDSLAIKLPHRKEFGPGLWPSPKSIVCTASTRKGRFYVSWLGLNVPAKSVPRILQAEVIDSNRRIRMVLPPAGGDSVAFAAKRLRLQRRWHRVGPGVLDTLFDLDPMRPGTDSIILEAVDEEGDTSKTILERSIPGQIHLGVLRASPRFVEVQVQGPSAEATTPGGSACLEPGVRWDVPNCVGMGQARTFLIPRLSTRRRVLVNASLNLASEDTHSGITQTVGLPDSIDLPPRVYRWDDSISFGARVWDGYNVLADSYWWIESYRRKDDVSASIVQSEVFGQSVLRLGWTFLTDSAQQATFLIPTSLVGAKGVSLSLNLVNNKALVTLRAPKHPAWDSAYARGWVPGYEIPLQGRREPKIFPSQFQWIMAAERAQSLGAPPPMDSTVFAQILAASSDLVIRVNCGSPTQACKGRAGSMEILEIGLLP